MAPTALTVFTGSAAAPTPLCSINLEAKKGGIKQFGCLGKSLLSLFYFHVLEELPLATLGSLDVPHLVQLIFLTS